MTLPDLGLSIIFLFHYVPTQTPMSTLSSVGLFIKTKEINIYNFILLVQPVRHI